VGHPCRMQFGPFLIDVSERVLQRDGQPVPLTPKAFDLLAALLERPGQLISKEELLQKVWPDTFVEESNLAYNVFSLRKALGDTAENSSYIETVPKKGYRFTAVVRPVVTAVRASASTDAENTVLLFHKGPLRSQAAVELKPELEELPAETSPAPSEVLPPRRLSLRRWAWIAAVPVLAVAVFLAARSRRESPTEPLRAVPLTSLPGVVRSPSFSPDGNYVVFSWNGPKQDNPDIYVQQVGVSSPPLRLTSDPSNDYGPSWSPDGRTIAFLRRAPAGGKSDVWRIAPLGGPERKVAVIQPRLAFFRPTSLGWCPDSTCLVVTDTLGDGQPDAVFEISVETGEKRQLTYPQGLVMDADPAISPDGRSLVFRRDGTPFSGEFYRLSLSHQRVPEGDPVRLTSTLLAGKPVWVPDTREILFSARGGLWRLDAFAGGTPTRLPFVGQDGTAPVVSRSLAGGRRLVYVRSFVDTNVWRVDTSAAGARAGAPPTAAIASTRGDTLPNLAPDSRRVVFLSDRSGDFEFWITDLDGSNAVQLTSMGILPGYAKWSPDGALIAFHGDPEGRPDVLVVPSRGGQPQIITKGTPGGAYPSFSRDGQWIYFGSGLAKGEQRIWKMPVSGGAPVQVTNNRGSIAIESYDRDLYYVDAADRPGTIWRLPAAGGAPVKVVEGVVLGNFDVVQGGLYYIDRATREAGAFFTDRPGGETRLRYFDFATSQSTTVADNVGTVGFGLTASRDGRTVFFSRVDSSVDELIFVENFR
jgi:Tol biopolymer transport system component/DNA-binding winged helix-turn-helix (wHTH) protein